MSDWPPIAALLPHAGPMRLLGAVLAHDASRTECRVHPAASALFRDGSGCVPAWVGIEYMAQCAAAHGGLAAHASGGTPRPGLLLGSRRVVFRCDGFAEDVPLRVTARHVAGRDGAVAFACTVEDPDGGPPLVEGRLNVLLLDPPPEGAA